MGRNFLKIHPSKKIIFAVHSLEEGQPKPCNCTPHVRKSSRDFFPLRRTRVFLYLPYPPTPRRFGPEYPILVLRLAVPTSFASNSRYRESPDEKIGGRELSLPVPLRRREGTVAVPQNGIILVADCAQEASWKPTRTRSPLPTVWRRLLKGTHGRYDTSFDCSRTKLYTEHLLVREPLHACTRP